MDNKIGDVAGDIWDFLEENGENSLSAVNNAIDAPRSHVNMAIGWLAREDKLVFNEEGRGSSISLK